MALRELLEQESYAGASMVSGPFASCVLLAPLLPL